MSESIKASEDAGKTGGIEYLAALAGNTPSAHNVRRYAEMVRESAERRRGMAATLELYDRFARGDLEDVRAELAERVAAIRTRGAGWDELDLATLAEREPEAPRHIIPNWLPSGEVTLLAGHGGAGKSLVSLGVSASISLGVPWHGLPVERRRVVYVSAEDHADILYWRLARVAANLGVALGDFAGWLRIFDASALDAELMIDPGRGEEPILTPRYDALARIVEPSTVLVLDGASDLYGASEIVRRHVRRFVRALRRLVGRDGAALLLAHLDKAAARDSSATDRYSGSTAWHNSVRSRWALGAAPDGDALVLTLAKANHARAGAEIRLRWDDDAHLYVADAAPAEGGIVGAIRDRQEREGILAAMRAAADAGIAVPAATQGRRTAYNVLAAQPSFPPALRADTPAVRRRFWAEIEQLRVMRAISDVVIRATHGHSVLTLVLVSGAS